MKASLTKLAAAGLILASGSAVLGSSGAAAGWRPSVFPHPTVSAWRGESHRAIEEGRRRAERGRRNRFDQFGGLFGDIGATEGETPAGEEETALQVAIFVPSIPGFSRAAAQSAGPKIIEIGKRAPLRARLPVVIYGDSSR